MSESDRRQPTPPTLPPSTPVEDRPAPEFVPLNPEGLSDADLSAQVEPTDLGLRESGPQESPEGLAAERVELADPLDWSEKRTEPAETLADEPTGILDVEMPVLHASQADATDSEVKRRKKIKPVSSAVKFTADGPSHFWQRATQLLFLIYVFLCLANIADAFLWHHKGWNCARRSVQALNYLKYGYVETGLRTYDNPGETRGKDGLPEKPDLYWHHPPGSQVYLSAWYGLLGKGEFQARLAFVLLSCAAFLMFWGAFRRASGDRTAFLVLFFWTFMPIMATYVNLVNFETMVFFAMACVLYGWERWREAKGWRWIGLMGLGVLTGVFTDWPALPFFFFFFLYMLTQLNLERDRLPGFFRRNGIAIFFALVVLACTALMVWLMFNWKESVDAWISTYNSRARVGNEGFLKVLKKWDGYLDFFTPVPYVLAAFYLLDVVPRVITRTLTRLDGYFLVFLGSALAYLGPLKQALMHHEYGALYFVPILAIVSGVSLHNMSLLLGRRHKVAVNLLLLLALVPTLVCAIPKIHAKHCSPMFEYTEPLMFNRNSEQYEFRYYYKALGPMVQALVKPDEWMVLSKIPHHPAKWFYLDRANKSSSDLKKLPGLIADKKYKAFLTYVHKIRIRFLGPLLKQNAHIRYRDFALFDLTGERLEHTEVRVLKREARSDLFRYFTGHSRGKVEVVTDHWRSLDYALKLDRSKDAYYHRLKTIEGAEVPDPLHKAIAEYNYAKSKGEKPDTDSVMKGLDTPKKPIKLPGGIKLVGYRLLREPDGAQRVTLVYSANKKLDQNYFATWEARPETETEAFKGKFKTHKREQPFDVPSSFWKPGWLYTAEFDMGVPFERWKLTTGMEYYDSFKVVDPKNHKDDFQLHCATLPLGEADRLDGLASRIKNQVDREAQLNALMQKSGLKKPTRKIYKKLGDDFTVLGCLAAQTEKGKDWQVRMVVRTDHLPQSDYTWSFYSSVRNEKWERKVKYPEDGRLTIRGDRRILSFNVSGKSRLPARGVQVKIAAPRGKSQRADQRLTVGNMGTILPLHWLLRLDAYRLQF